MKKGEESFCFVIPWPGRHGITTHSSRSPDNELFVTGHHVARTRGYAVHDDYYDDYYDDHNDNGNGEQMPAVLALPLCVTGFALTRLLEGVHWDAGWFGNHVTYPLPPPPPVSRSFSPFVLLFASYSLLFLHSLVAFAVTIV